MAREQKAALPPQLSHGASLHGLEYAWSIDGFQEALKLAPALGYACLGGQFWLLPSPSVIYELFWIEANASERIPGEPWNVYAKRSCIEVFEGFELLLKSMDFRQEALKCMMGNSFVAPPVFNAYFVTELEWARLQSRVSQATPNGI